MVLEAVFSAFCIFICSMLLSGTIAQRKGYDSFAWFFLGGMFNIGAVLVIMILPDKIQKTRKTLNKYIKNCNKQTLYDYDDDCASSFILNNKKKYRLKGV